jgi:hypothetical protein
MTQVGDFKPCVVMIGGAPVIRNSVKNTMFERPAILYKKEDQASLNDEKRAILYEKATKTRHNRKFDVISLTLTDADKLDETYNLEILIKKTETAHVTFDMHGVFNIVYPSPVDDGTFSTTKNLYTEYSDITVEEVATSNHWYNANGLISLTKRTLT